MENHDNNQNEILLDEHLKYLQEVLDEQKEPEGVDKHPDGKSTSFLYEGQRYISHELSSDKYEIGNIRLSVGEWRISSDESAEKLLTVDVGSNKKLRFYCPGGDWCDNGYMVEQFVYLYRVDDRVPVAVARFHKYDFYSLTLNFQLPYEHLVPGKYFIYMPGASSSNEKCAYVLLEHGLAFPFRMEFRASDVGVPKVVKAKAQHHNSGHICTAPCSGVLRLNVHLARLSEKENTFTAYCYDARYTLMGQDVVTIRKKDNYVLRHTFEFRSHKPWREQDYTVVICMDGIPFAEVTMHMKRDASPKCTVRGMDSHTPLYWLVKTFEAEPYKIRWNAAREFGGVREAKLHLARLHREWTRLAQMGIHRSSEVMFVEGDRHLFAGRLAMSCGAILKTGKYEECKVDCRTADMEKMMERLDGRSRFNGLQVFYNAGSLAHPKAVWVMETLLSRMTADNEGTLYVFCDSKTELKKLFMAYPQLESLISKDLYIKVESCDAAEVTDLLLHEIRRNKMCPTAKPTDRFETVLEEAIALHLKEYRLNGWEVKEMAGYVDKLYEAAVQRTGLHSDDQDVILIEEDDLPDLENFLRHNPPRNVSSHLYLQQMRAEFDKVMEQLNEMVGLSELKEGMNTVFQKMVFNKLRSGQGLPVEKEASHHIIFTGNPGTGKTTVAKLVGKIYKMLGVLSRGDVIVADRKELVGQYIGETEQNMKEVLERARGNVLFIDEAYSLWSDSQDRRDYGSRVIEALLPVLAEPNPDMVVIMAGYEQDMNRLMTKNQGLRSRFAQTWHFSDYTAEELFEIARRELVRFSYRLDECAAISLMQLCTRMVAHKGIDFANARWVKQVVNNGVLPAMARRVMTAFVEDDFELLTIIREEDVLQAAEKYGPKEVKVVRRIGFCGNYSANTATP